MSLNRMLTYPVYRLWKWRQYRTLGRTPIYHPFTLESARIYLDQQAGRLFSVYGFCKVRRHYNIMFVSEEERKYK